MSLQFNPEMLVLAREAVGKHQKDVAEALGVSQSKVSKMEAGVLVPSDEEVAALGRLYRRPVEFFAQPSARQAGGPSCFHNSRRRTVPVGVMRRTHAELEMRRLEMEHLFRDIEFTGPNGFAPLNLDDYAGSTEAMAHVVRTRWGLGLGPVPNMVTAIERAGGVVVPCKFASRKIDALSIALADKSPLFFINMDHPADKMRFALAHEVAHIVMHRETAPGPKQVEDEAQAFAAAFLMPDRVIKPEFARPTTLQSLSAMKPKWKVPIKAMIYRAGSLNVVTDAQLVRLYQQFSKLGWNTREPLEFPPETPTLIQEAVKLHGEQHSMSMGEIASMVRSTPETFAADYFPKHGHLRLVG